MKDFFDFLVRVVPALKLFPEWVQLLICSWLVFSAVVAAVVIFQYEPASNLPPKKTTSRTLPLLSAPWPNTGDSDMDKVFAKLNKIEERGTATESELRSPIREFFQRNVFSHIQEEPPESAAYVFGHGERLLAHYQPFYDQQPTAYDAIGTAKTRLIKLQQIFSQACGPDRFFVQTTFSSLPTKKTEFEKALIQANLQPLDVTTAREANETLSQLRENLQAAGL